MKVLLAGCGGTGIEILKYFAENDNSYLLVDYDRIELSNLHRLYMFTLEDQGEFKAKKAAEFVKNNYNQFAEYTTKKVEALTPEILNDYDIIISALDSVNSRMYLNLLFKKSKVKLLIDCGVAGLKVHVKAVYNNSSCLYCIKELYANMPFVNMCSLKSLDGKITDDNRINFLLSFIEKHKRKLKCEKKNIEFIVNEFNLKVEEKFKTNEFEVYGYYHDIMPTTCYINSIAAGLVKIMYENYKNGLKYDYIFYNGEGNIHINKLMLEADDNCMICKESQ